MAFRFNSFEQPYLNFLYVNSKTNLGPSILCFNNDYDGTLKRFLIRNYLENIEISAKYESNENMNYKRDGMIVNNSRFTEGKHGSSVVYTYALASDSRMDDHKNVGSSWSSLFRRIDM